MQNGSTAFRFVRLAVLPFFAVKSTLLKVRCTHYSEIFLYSPESLFASFLWKYPNSKTLMERRSSIRFCNFFTPSAVGWTSIACCAPSIRREMRKYLQFSITRSQILMRIPAEQSKMFSILLFDKRTTKMLPTRINIKTVVMMRTVTILEFHQVFCRWHNVEKIHMKNSMVQHILSSMLRGKNHQ